MSDAPLQYISQDEALKFKTENPSDLTKAQTAGKRLYISVDISDLSPGTEFKYLNPKDAPKVVMGSDGVAQITALDGAVAESLRNDISQKGFTPETLPKGKYDQTVTIKIPGLSEDAAKTFLEKIRYTSQTVVNGEPGQPLYVIQAAVSDAQAKEILGWWKEQGRKADDFQALVTKITEVQVAGGAARGDVYDDKTSKLTDCQLVTGNDVAEDMGFSRDGYYVRSKTAVEIVAVRNVILQGRDSKDGQHVNGDGILIYETDKNGVVSVRSSAADHATRDGNFLDESGKALTSLAGISRAVVDNTGKLEAVIAGGRPGPQVIEAAKPVV